MNKSNDSIHLKLQQQFSRTEITCLSLFDNHVISGMGSFITVFDISSSMLLAHIRVFHNSRVHGICKGSETYFLIFGEREIAIAFYDFNINKVEIKVLWHVGDWIHCVQWLEDENIAIASAHNSVILWNWKKKEKLMTAYCEERCILYSCSFFGSSWEKLIVFAGTVYKEVIMWSPARSGCYDKNCAVLHRLQGHKGVIFSSHYNPETGRLHTTSDDRSVKGWQINHHETHDWQLADIKLIYTLYGHTARVWKSIGLKTCTISIGEDSNVCLWNMDGKLLKRCSMHQGGSIWSLACLEEKDLLFTGGSDGSISILSLKSCQKNCSTFPVSCDAKCINQMSEPNIPRRVILLKTFHMIIVFQSGHVMSCFVKKSCTNFISEEDIFKANEDQSNSCPSDTFVWSHIYFSPQLISYCLLEVSPCRQRFALASLDGQILIFEEITQSEHGTNLQKIIETKAVGGKIYSLQWLSSNKILTCEAFGRLILWSVEKTTDGSFCLLKTKTLTLPNSKERWVTTALIIDHFLVCGDRMGSIHMYSVQEDSKENYEPCHTLSKVHGRLGVSFLMVHSTYLYSCGRDGTLRLYQIQKIGESLNQLCATRMPFDWVTALCCFASDILVLGFSEKNFVVWSQQQQRLVFEVPCGGGHRSWDFIRTDYTMNFVYIKHNSLFNTLLNLKTNLKPFLQTGFHPREVNCLQIHNKNLRFPIFISGGEDTTIRVSQACSPSQFHTLAVLHSHISSVRALAINELSEDKILLFSSGGRAQIKAWELTTEHLSDNTEFPNILCKELSSHMLMDVNNKPSNSWKHLQPTINPETRYMSLCSASHNGIVLIAAGCSDGYLRIFHYQQEQLMFQLVGSSKFHNRCILNVAYVSPLIVLTMATDGIVAFWDLTPFSKKDNTEKLDYTNEFSDCNKIEPFSYCKLHQSGIDSYDLILIESDHLLLATGGDDTALVITAFRIMNNPVSVSQVLQWQMPSAHVAQITGLAFIDHYLISTSVDQYIYIWKWYCDVTRQLLFVTKLAEYCTTVADIHGLKAWSSRDSFCMCVYGKGIEIIEGNAEQERKYENKI